ncbi:MAG TPA: hypothetical protein VFQ35_06185 [Polyangiaceae bacterium]|nr:hypothetical protein [Polyangiaceae bacterium]
MSSRNEHRTPERIAQGHIVAVDQCDCGTLHVHIGAVSLRLDVPALRDLLSTLGQALAVRTAADYTTQALSLSGTKRGIG